MKKYINKILGAVLFLAVLACSEEMEVDNVIDGVASGGVLRNLGETNELDIAVGSSTYSIVLEAQDATGGNLLQEVIVNVGFNDIDEEDMGLDTVAVSEFARIPASAFDETSPTTNDLPVATFSATLDELTAHVGGTIEPGMPTTVEATDAFVIDFQMVLTDGRIFNADNATGDVTRTGRFSFFNGQFRYSPVIGDPQRLVVAEFAITVDATNKSNRLRSGKVDTVFIRFDEEDALTTSPTITARSAIGQPDVELPAIVETVDSDDNQVYYALFTAPATVADTISFVASGGERVSGLTMENDTLKNGYIIDNVAPTATIGTSLVQVYQDSIRNINLQFTFAEALGQDTVLFIFDSNAAQFVTDTVSAVIASGSESVTLDFVPVDDAGKLIPNAELDFDVFTDYDPGAGVDPEEEHGILDLTGNQEPDSVNVDL